MDTALEFREVHKSLGGKLILRGISFSVYVGDVFGYLGPNGAGKTTTIRVLLDLLPPDGGEVRLFGRPSDPEARRRIGFVLENDGLFDGLTAAENLALFARLYGVSRPKVGELLELVGLGGKEGDRVGTFSKGMRQRLALARALLHDPELLVLDEPTAGLDPTGQMEVRELIRELAGGGKTVFLSSHNLDEVERLCNRIALIHHGEIRLQGDMRELMRGDKTGYVVELAEPLSPELVERLHSRMELGFVGEESGALLFEPREVGLGELVSSLEGMGIEIEAVRRARASLEELYREIMAEEA
jgi:ABC-2 type transport system ATP-binding protein